MRERIVRDAKQPAAVDQLAVVRATVRRKRRAKRDAQLVPAYHPAAAVEEVRRRDRTSEEHVVVSVDEALAQSGDEVEPELDGHGIVERKDVLRNDLGMADEDDLGMSREPIRDDRSVVHEHVYPPHPPGEHVRAPDGVAQLAVVAEAALLAALEVRSVAPAVNEIHVRTPPPRPQYEQDVRHAFRHVARDLRPADALDAEPASDEERDDADGLLYGVGHRDEVRAAVGLQRVQGDVGERREELSEDDDPDVRNALEPLLAEDEADDRTREKPQRREERPQQQGVLQRHPARAALAADELGQGDASDAFVDQLAWKTCPAFAAREESDGRRTPQLADEQAVEVAVRGMDHSARGQLPSVAQQLAQGRFYGLRLIPARPCEPPQHACSGDRLRYDESGYGPHAASGQGHSYCGEGAKECLCDVRGGQLVEHLQAGEPGRGRHAGSIDDHGCGQCGEEGREDLCAIPSGDKGRGRGERASQGKCDANIPLQRGSVACDASAGSLDDERRAESALCEDAADSGEDSEHGSKSEVLGLQQPCQDDTLQKANTVDDDFFKSRPQNPNPCAYPAHEYQQSAITPLSSSACPTHEFQARCHFMASISLAVSLKLTNPPPPAIGQSSPE